MNISLTGMPGSGKTTIGKLLTKALPGYRFIDTDSETEKKEGKSISRIFEENGETYFREVESEILKNILNKDNNIISTGGGIIKKEENIRILKEKSIVIYLKADAKTLFERVKNNTERPLLNVDDIEDKIKTLLKERSKYYEQGHITVDTTGKTTGAIINEILRETDKYGKN